MTTPHWVQKIIVAAGNKIAGKTRLQKSVYFLEAAGIGYGFDFNYHYYGPYSEELAIAVADAEALELIKVKHEVSQTGAPYAVYELNLHREEEVSDDVTMARRQEILKILERYDAISLELAATADFLARNGYANDPWSETRRRKSVKAKPERIEAAKRLLDQLQMPVT